MREKNRGKLQNFPHAQKIAKKNSAKPLSKIHNLACPAFILSFRQTDGRKDRHRSTLSYRNFEKIPLKYSTYKWNTKSKRLADFFKIQNHSFTIC